MRAGKFVMLMYTIRTVYTLLILLGFSLKNAAPSAANSECRCVRIWRFGFTATRSPCLLIIITPNLLYISSHEVPQPQRVAPLFVLQLLPAARVHRRQRTSLRVLHRPHHHLKSVWHPPPLFQPCMLPISRVFFGVTCDGLVTEPVVCLVSLWGSTGLPITERPPLARQALLSGVDEVLRKLTVGQQQPLICRGSLERTNLLMLLLCRPSSASV
jgi:hypothetical protein